MARLWVLGSAGWMPRRGQETACFLLEAGDSLIMLDAGTGVANLALVPDVIAAHDHLTILLSHYHLDHVCGLMYLKRFVGDMSVDVYGPGRPIYPKTTEAYAGDLLQRALYSSGAHGFAREVSYHDYGGQDFRIGEIDVFVRPQTHSAPSFELRLGDLVVYATDTRFTADAWEHVRPAQLLLHECWQKIADDPRHTSAEALAQARLCDTFDEVLLVHHNPAWTDEEHSDIHRIAGSVGMRLAEDGLAVDLGA